MAGEANGDDVELLRGQETLPGLLHTATRSFVEAVDGVACAISRVVGDVLIQVAEYSLDGRTLVLGHGYLISDFPLTMTVLDTREPKLCSLLDESCDAREAELLRELRLDSLLMLPLAAGDLVWGLAEVYANGRKFTDDELARLRPLADAFGARVVELPAPASRT
jgi:hypothetical protein